MKTHARVLIIGGGVTGCGLAYHLTKLGWADIVLVEKNELTAGATWHAAGHVMHYSNGAILTKLQKETTDLFPTLEHETGQPVGFHRSGAIRLIVHPDQQIEYRRAVAKAELFGVEMEIVAPQRVKELFPLLQTRDLLGGVYTPGDGHVDPSMLTFAYAKGARMGGVEINTQCKVTGLDWRGDHWQASTVKGTIRAEIIVNCAGMWAPELAAMLGVRLPLIVFMHQHMVTEDHPAVAALDRELVLIRDSINGFNCRQEGKGLLSGVYEHAPEFVFVDGIPPEFGKELMTPNLDRSADFIARAIERVPALGEVGIRMVYNGPTSRTPDHQPLLGPMPGLPNCFIAAGYAAGFVQASFTRQVAQWIVEGEPGTDMSEFDVRRFVPYGNREFAFRTVHAAHAFSNTPGYPHGERGAGRPARTSPLYDRLATAGAVYGVRNGWEVPNYFAAEQAPPKPVPGFTRPHWFGPAGDECRSAARAVGILDLSYLAKFEVTGTAAATALDAVLHGVLPEHDGGVARCPMLTARGGIATLLTVVRLAADHFLLLGPGEYEARDADDLGRRLAQHGALFRNVTGAHSILLVTGPHARELLATCCRSDLSVSLSEMDFPPETARQASLGYAPATIVRHEETGLGDWLVVVPSDFARPLYEVLRQAGAAHGAVDIGMRAWDALRLEHGTPVVGLDIDRTMPPSEAGLVPADRRATSRRSRDGEAMQLVRLRVSSGQNDPYQNDVVRYRGKVVGLVRGGGLGHLGGASLAFAVIPASAATADTALAVEIYGTSHPATVLPWPSGATHPQTE
jgi:dimethylglycine dehydrogenase